MEQLNNFYVNIMYTTFLLDDILVNYLKKDVATFATYLQHINVQL